MISLIKFYNNDNKALLKLHNNDDKALLKLHKTMSTVQYCKNKQKPIMKI